MADEFVIRNGLVVLTGSVDFGEAFLSLGATGSATLPAGDKPVVLTYDTVNNRVTYQLAASGSLGAQGAIGAQGVQGLQGIKGLQGTIGIQGQQGSQGTQGNIQGIQGTQGSQAVQG